MNELERAKENRAKAWEKLKEKRVAFHSLEEGEDGFNEAFSAMDEAASDFRKADAELDALRGVAK